MKRLAWTLLIVMLILTYYLSSIPGLEVLPVLKEVNLILQKLDVSVTGIVYGIASRLPDQLDPAKSVASRFYAYARENPETMEFLLRKASHVALFFVVTVVFFMLLRQYTKNPWSALLFAVALGSLMGFLDEYYQTFVAGRSGNLVDVFFDLAGVLCAAVFISFALLITGRTRSRT